MSDFDCHNSTAIYSCCVYGAYSSFLVILSDSYYGNPSCNHHPISHDFEICICVNAFPCRRFFVLAVTLTVIVIVIVIVIVTVTVTVAENVICIVSALRPYL